MTTPNLSCDQFNDALADFLEREVSDATRAAMDAHAIGCAECGPLLADLRKLRIDAANLPELVPSRDLWTEIAARIETPVVEIGTGEHRVPSMRPSRRRWLEAGLAAAGLVAITAGVTYRLTTRALASSRVAAGTVPAAPIIIHDTVQATTVPFSSPSPAATVASNPATTPARTSASSPAVARTSAATPVARLASNEQSPDRTYEVEIARLRTIVDKRRSTLDTATVHVIDQNLLIIDAAIAQCRAALAKDPASRFLIQSLNDALDDKVQLLRTATLLPSAAEY